MSNHYDRTSRETEGEAKARLVAGMFAHVSRRYDLLNTVMTGGQDHRWRARAANLAAEGMLGPALDVAAGTGDLAFALASHPGVTRVVGVDIVEEMVTLAQRKARRRGLSERVAFLRGDAQELPFSDNSFACVVSGFAMRNVVDVAVAVAEMVRVAQPGGRIAILEIMPRETEGLASAAQRCYLQYLVPVLGGALASEREAYRYFAHSVDDFQSPEKLAATMEATGLRLTHRESMGFGAVKVLVGGKQA
ncbi:MAG: ubiquinone/menaquinone biosynthesis methyltransferase [Chloroflexi bacterium]|nr:ubiquinone/menaquinone biosynthesis methyltransferase [Chloroflexota bacterium]